MTSHGIVRIGLFGPYHSDNLGDTATQMAVMANLRLRNPRIDFIGICSNPPDVARTHGIPAFHMSGNEFRLYERQSRSDDTEHGQLPAKQSWLIRFIPGSLYEVWKHVRQSWNILRFTGRLDGLLISGGGQLCDFWGGAWARPFEMLAWALACRLRGKKVIVLATAVDNLTSRAGRTMCFLAMRLSNYTAYRDEFSVIATRAAGLSNPGHACPDAAFSLPLSSHEAPAKTEGGPVVVVCPISERAWMYSSNSVYERYLDELVDACEQLVAGGVVIQLSNSQVRMDIQIAQATFERLRKRFVKDPALADRVRITLSHTVDEFIALARQVDLVLASRLHGVILPIVAGTPVVGVAYMRKVSQVMADSGLSRYCTELRDSSADQLVALVRGALEEGNALRAHIRAINTQFREALDREYSAIADILANG